MIVALTALAACSDSPTGPPKAGDETPPPAAQPAVFIEIVPGALLLAGSGTNRKLTVRALDARGEPTTANVVWSSSSPAVTMSPDGTATATVSVGSAVIIAETSTGLKSLPIAAIVAKPVAGAVLLNDEQVDGGLIQVDPGDQFGAGWKYKVLLQHIVAPAPGTILIASGGATVAGKVIAVEPSGSKFLVTIELVSLRQLFDDLQVRIEMPLVSELPGTASASVAPAWWQSLGPTMNEIEVPLGPFKCKFEGLPPSITLQNVTNSVSGSLTGEVNFSFATGVKLLARGTIAGQMTARPVVDLAWEGNAKCERDIPGRPYTLPIGGPLALFFGLQVPTGAGFSLHGKLDVGQVGFDVAAEGSAAIQVGFECPATGDCAWLNAFDSRADGSLKLIAPDLGEARVALDGRGYVYAKLQLGPNARLIQAASFLQNVKFKFLEASAGVEQRVDLASAHRQVAEADYASTFDFRFNAELKADLEVRQGFDWLGQKLGVVLQVLEEPLLEFETELARSPRGTFSISPASVAPGNNQQLGERATFTVHLDPVVYLGVQSVEKVEIFWRKDDGSGGFTMELGRPGCTTMTSTPGQTTFECGTDFLEAHEGNQDFYAFVHVRMFGLPVPVPLEVSVEGKATVHVQSVNALSWTFDTDLDGWSVANAGREYDTARWVSNIGNPPGGIHLDGSDFFQPDGQPNGWAYKLIQLPAGATSLTFDTRAQQVGQDGALRVRLVRSGGQSQTLLDWEVLGGSAWVARSADISAYAGESVTIFFEQSDNDVGSGEGRFIDNVKIVSSGAP